MKLDNEISVIASPLSHPIITHGYTFVNPTPPPVIDMQKVLSLGLDPKCIGYLQKGMKLKKYFNSNNINNNNSIVKKDNDGNRSYYQHSFKDEIAEIGNDGNDGNWHLSENSELENSQFIEEINDQNDQYISLENISTDERKKPLKISVIMDTCESERAIEACTDCDVLVHECTYENSLKESALEHGHSTAEMAGEFARKVNAKLLVLTHFSARYKTTENLVKEAQREFGSLNVIAAEDFMILGKNGNF